MTKPKIVLSRCFSTAVRYNGGIVIDDFVEKLKEFVDFIDFCPEYEIGLGVPRPKIVVVKDENSKRLIQPDKGIDLTEKMLNYVNKTINEISDIDGFILKSKSPSCGVGSTKLYFKGSVIGKTYGFFAEAIRNRFPFLPLEDEGRLKDKGIRNHFLTQIFAFSELRDLSKNISSKTLIDFHSRYKYLIMTYSQKHLIELGRVVADGKMAINEKLLKYKEIFYDAFKRKPSKNRHINTLMHMMGHFSKKLNNKEKKHFLNLLEKYRNNMIDLSVMTELLKNFALRFESEYIFNQKYLQPFPEELNKENT